MDMVPLRVIVDLVAKANDVCAKEAQSMLRIPLQQIGYSPTATRLTFRTRSFCSNNWDQASR